MNEASKAIGDYVCANLAPEQVAAYCEYLDELGCLSDPPIENAIDALLNAVQGAQLKLEE